MAPPNKDTRSLIRRLTKATSNGSVQWDAVGRATFALDRSSGSLLVESKDGDDSHPYRFAIFNPQENLLIDSETILGERYRPWEGEIEDLYQAAKRNALGTDSVLRSLETDLGLDLIQDQDPELDVPF